MSVALANQASELSVQHNEGFSQKQIDILKNGICRGCSNQEFEVFLMACKKTQLDPFMKQIYAVKRKAKKPDGSWGETMTIQTGIDGYRLIAERTGNYVPGAEPTYVYDEQQKLISATAYVKKRTSDGEWHTIASSAYYDEYCQKFKDGQPMGLWANMPRTMLAKCAEAQALRRAFPAEMSGVYTKEEMSQADIELEPKPVEPKINDAQIQDLAMILEECDESYRNWVFKRLKTQYNIDALRDIPVSLFGKIRDASVANMEKIHELQRQNLQIDEVTGELLSN